MRLLISSTVPETLDLFMRGQLSWLRAQGHDIHVVSSPGPALSCVATREGVIAHPIPMAREMSPVSDGKALLRWLKELRSISPEVVVVSTPKAGLLGGIASALLRIPRRVYLLRGARFEGESGVRGLILRCSERIACKCAHRVIAVSPSLASLALKARIVPARKLGTVGAGSSNGVDLTRFSPPAELARAQARSRWEVGASDVAVTFVGRLHPDKGLAVLRDALAVVSRNAGSRVILLLAGTDEGAELDVPDTGMLEVRRLGHVNDVPDLLRASDILVLPTQREGFPNVVLEAAASGLPAVTTDATGAVDSVVDGVTGLVVPRADGRALGEALTRLVNDSAFRTELGAAARRRVEDCFTQELVWEGMYREYLGPSSRFESPRGASHAG